MKSESNDYKVQVQQAYDSVKGLEATEDYKLAGYQIVLKAIMDGPITINQATHQKDGDFHKGNDTRITAVEDWQSQIASRIGIDAQDISEIYHRTDDGSIELIIEAKDLPSTNSKSTIDLAALLSAGRQATGDEKTTSFEVIRKAAEYYRVYDRKNFARTIRLLGSKFRIDNTASPATIELTNGAYKIAGEIARKYLEKK